jgi:hypothetical protein
MAVRNGRSRKHQMCPQGQAISQVVCSDRSADFSAEDKFTPLPRQRHEKCRLMNARPEADFRCFSRQWPSFLRERKISDENPRPELLCVRRSALVVIVHALS